MTGTFKARSLIKRFEVKPSDDDDAVETTAFINSDIMPLPPSRRSWGPASFVGFWLVCEYEMHGPFFGYCAFDDFLTVVLTPLGTLKAMSTCPIGLQAPL